MFKAQTLRHIDIDGLLFLIASSDGTMSAIDGTVIFQFEDSDTIGWELTQDETYRWELTDSGGYC